MIQTAKDLDTAIAYCSKEKNVYVGDIEAPMASDTYNKALRAIESQLNAIYEKMRTLEDIHSYCKSHILKTIEVKRSLFRERMRVIEQDADAYLDQGFVACHVPITKSNAVARDRDGTTLFPADIVDGKLCMAGRVCARANIKSVEKSQSVPEYFSTADVLPELPYRAFYAFAVAPPNGVEEEITLRFNRAISLNAVRYIPVNCSIVEIGTLNASEAYESLGDTNAPYFPARTAYGLRMKLKATNAQISAAVAGPSYSDDYWKGLTYAQSLGRTPATLYGISEALSMRQFDNGKRQFLIELERWKQAKEVVERQNRKRIFRCETTQVSENATHVRTSRSVSSAAVISNTELGIVESLKEGWRFLPADELERKETHLDGPYQLPPSPQLTQRVPGEKFNAKCCAAGGEITNYFFGLDALEIAERLPDDANGVILDSIMLGNCSYIELSADLAFGSGGAVEFYIVDGIKEIAILPLECDRVSNERIFFNLPLRFAVDKEKAITVKKNGLTVSSSSDLADLKIDRGTYTIDYTPLAAWQYRPENDRIAIKIVQRCYEKDGVPPYLRGLLIRKYGGEVPWQE